MGIEGSNHVNNSWQGQLARIRRWYVKVEAIGRAENPTSNLEEEHDVVYAFFMNCYHLRDWLQNSNVVSSEALREFFNDHIEMMACRDICNGLKHFKLERSSLDSEFSIGREYMPASSSTPRPGLNETWFIIIGEHKFDIFELAKACMTLWEEFISTHLGQ